MPLFTSELSYSDDYPTIEPSLKLDFANARALDPRITFTRASRATYVGRDGLVKYAGEDEARFDHDPTTGESLGLLIEASSNNYFPNSQTLSDWSISNSSLATNTSETLSPDGNNNSLKLTATGSGVIEHGAVQFTSINNYQQSTFSVWLKTASGNGNFQMSIGNVVYPGNATTGYIAVYDASVEEYPNGWYRFSIRRDWGAAVGGTSLAIYLNANSGGGSYGVVTPQTFEQSGEALYIWGPQWENNQEGPITTTYIPTSGASATRAVEYGYTSNMNFYNQSEGSVFSEVKLLDVGNTGGKVIWSFNQAGGFGEGIYMANENGGPNLTFNLFDGGSNLAAKGTTNITTGTYYKTIYSFETNNVNLGYYGNIGTDDTSATLPTIGRLVIGNNAWGGLTGGSNGFNPGNCHIKSFSYYPKRLTNTQLQTLTQ